MRYQVGKELGRGGMGSVHEAVGPDGRRVALKVLHAFEREDLERFEREARLLETLGELPGFVPYLDRGRDARGPYVVMPLLTGGSLRERLRGGPLGQPRAVALVIELARALGRAHGRGVVHRDLKPENVLFDEHGRAFVTDLGLAKHYRRDVSGASRSRALTGEGTVLGTLGYAPREQLEDATAAGPPADVFALGAILFELLTGFRAFPGRSLAQQVEELARPRSPRELNARVPRWLDRVVRRALAPAPADRYPDGEALALALEAGLGRGRRLLLAGAAALLGVLLVGVGAFVAVGSGRGAGGPPSAATAATAAVATRARPPRNEPPPAPPVVLPAPPFGRLAWRSEPLGTIVAVAPLGDHVLALVETGHVHRLRRVDGVREDTRVMPGPPGRWLRAAREVAVVASRRGVAFINRSGWVQPARLTPGLELVDLAVLDRAPNVFGSGPTTPAALVVSAQGDPVAVLLAGDVQHVPKFRDAVVAAAAGDDVVVVVLEGGVVVRRSVAEDGQKDVATLPTPVEAVLVSRDGERILAQVGPSTFLVEEGRAPAPLPGCRPLALSDDGHVAALLLEGGRLGLVGLPDLRRLGVVDVKGPRAAVFLLDGALVVASDDGTVTRVDLPVAPPDRARHHPTWVVPAGGVPRALAAVGESVLVLLETGELASHHVTNGQPVSRQSVARDAAWLVAGGDAAVVGAPEWLQLVSAVGTSGERLRPPGGSRFTQVGLADVPQPAVFALTTDPAPRVVMLVQRGPVTGLDLHARGTALAVTPGPRLAVGLEDGQVLSAVVREERSFTFRTRLDGAPRAILASHDLTRMLVHLDRLTVFIDGPVARDLIELPGARPLALSPDGRWGLLLADGVTHWLDLDRGVAAALDVPDVRCAVFLEGGDVVLGTGRGDLVRLPRR